MAGNGLQEGQIQEFQSIYSPSTLLGVYAAAIKTPADGKLLLARGIYQATPGAKEYSGYYYENIKSQHEAKSIKARIPSLLRSTLEDNHIYVFKGFIEKKVSFSTIELVFVVDEILQKEENQFTEEDQKRFSLLQKKLGKTFHDFEAIVKKSVYTGKKLKIANLYGNVAIVHKDFELGLGEAAVYFDITSHRCNFHSKVEIINTLKLLNKESVDAIGIVRGGGEKISLDVFNDPELGEAALNLTPILITALGHTVDTTLLDKLSDKKFALPHDYGNSLKVWIDAATEEQTKSKSVFINQVKADLDKTYREQIVSLETQLKVRNKENEQVQLKFNEILETTRKQKDEAILASTNSFNTQLKSLQEQLKAKEDSLKSVQMNYESSINSRISSAVAEIKANYSVSIKENESLKKELLEQQSKNSNVLIYIIVGASIGLLIGLLLRG